MTKGPEVISGRVREQGSLEVRTRGKCPAHVSRASLLVPGNDDSSDDKVSYTVLDLHRKTISDIYLLCRF